MNAQIGILIQPHRGIGAQIYPALSIWLAPLLGQLCQPFSLHQITDRNRRQLKSATFDLGAESLLSVQDRVARLAADWLGLTMSAAAAQTATPVKNVTAFAAYLRGLFQGRGWQQF